MPLVKYIGRGPRSLILAEYGKLPLTPQMVFEVSDVVVEKLRQANDAMTSPLYEFLVDDRPPQEAQPIIPPDIRAQLPPMPATVRPKKFKGTNLTRTVRADKRQPDILDKRR